MSGVRMGLESKIKLRFPPKMSQNLANLTDYEGLSSRIAQIRQDVHALWGRMSAHQMVCHLADSFRAMLGGKAVSPTTSWIQRNVIKPLALWAPAKWPHGVPTRPELDQTTGGGTPPVDFERDRKDLLEIMSKFRLSTEQTTHPMFGPLTHKEWMRWGYLHVDHHLRQFGQ